MRQIKPLANRVFVEVVEQEKTHGGVLLVTHQNRIAHCKGIVRFVGNGRLNDATGERIPIDLKPGDKIVYEKYAGIELKVDGKPYRVIQRDSVIAVEEE